MFAHKENTGCAGPMKGYPLKSYGRAVMSDPSSAYLPWGGAISFSADPHHVDVFSYCGGRFLPPLDALYDISWDDWDAGSCVFTRGSGGASLRLDLDAYYILIELNSPTRYP